MNCPGAPKKKNPTTKMDNTAKNIKWRDDLQERFQKNMDEEPFKMNNTDKNTR